MSSNAIPGSVPCPMIEAWTNNRVNINREIRILKQNLKICGACETAHGPCSRLNCVRNEVSQALGEALAELGLKA